MGQDIFTPHADLIDDGLFIETRQTAAATTALWQILQLSHREPRSYLPTFVFAGEHGAGLTTIAKRFVRAAARNVACDLVSEALADYEPEQVRRDDTTWSTALTKPSPSGFRPVRPP